MERPGVAGQCGAVGQAYSYRGFKNLCEIGTVRVATFIFLEWGTYRVAESSRDLQLDRSSTREESLKRYAEFIEPT